MDTSNLKTIVRGSYDIQALRIQMGNRIVCNFKAKLGQKPSEKEDEMDSKGKLILKNLRASFKKITDGVKIFPSKTKFVGDELISQYTELVLISQYIEFESLEKRHFRMLGKVLEDYPIYTEWLIDVRGVGPAMAGVLISEIDIHKAEYPSSLHMYAGLDVAEDGKGRSRRKEHLRDWDYIDKDGNPAVRKGITFNPFLKTKLIGVLAASFLRAVIITGTKEENNRVVENNKYSQIYYDYKNRLENHPSHIEKTKGHRHNMAKRYMIKIFLLYLYIEWRKIEGLTVSKPYHEAKLGIIHKKNNKQGEGIPLQQMR